MTNNKQAKVGFFTFHYSPNFIFLRRKRGTKQVLSTLSIKAELASYTFHQTGAQGHCAHDQSPLVPAFHLTEFKVFNKDIQNCNTL